MRNQINSSLIFIQSKYFFIFNAKSRAMSKFIIGKIEDLQDGFGAKMDGFGNFANGLAGFPKTMKNRDPGVANFQNPRGQTAPADRMAVLVQGAVLDVMQAVLDLPVTTRERLEIGRKDRLRIKTCDKISRVTRFQDTVTPNLPVDTESNPAVRDAKRLSNPVGNDVVAPEFANVHAAAFFSTVTLSGSVVGASLK